MNRYRVVTSLLVVVLLLSIFTACKPRHKKSSQASEEHAVEQTMDMSNATLERWIDTTLSIISPSPYQVSRRVNMQVGSHNVAGEVRMVAGDRVWINVSLLGITFARAMFTEDSLMYYERLRKTSFEGTWEDLHRVHGALAVVDYHMVESMMFARPVYKFNRRELSERENGRMTFVSQHPKKGFDYKITIDELSHRIISQEVVAVDGAVSYMAEYVYDGDGRLKEALFNVSAANYIAARFTYGAERETVGSMPFKMPSGFMNVREMLLEIGVDVK
ncbi:MAG: DUF4292 domain-containing protein [Flavobacteriales bacterium]|nr:DUF4292 domain-containing protein [Flavobacteriales bacterium]